MPICNNKLEKMIYNLPFLLRLDSGLSSLWNVRIFGHIMNWSTIWKKNNENICCDLMLLSLSILCSFCPRSKTEINAFKLYFIVKKFQIKVLTKHLSTKKRHFIRFSTSRSPTTCATCRTSISFQRMKRNSKWPKKSFCKCFFLMIPFSISFKDRHAHPISNYFRTTYHLLLDLRTIIWPFFRKLKLKRFEPEAFENPDLQSHYRLIESLALQQDDVEPVTDFTMPPKEKMDKKLGPVLVPIYS